MVQARKDAEAFDDNPVAKLRELMDSAASDFEKAPAGYLELIESGQQEEFAKAYPDLTPEFLNKLRLFGEGKISKDEFMVWVLRSPPPERHN